MACMIKPLYNLLFSPAKYVSYDKWRENTVQKDRYLESVTIYKQSTEFYWPG